MTASTPSSAVSTTSSRVSGFLAAILHPLLPAMLGSSAVRVIVVLATAFGLLSDGDPTYTILQAVGDGFFYFFPILLAYSIAKRQGSSQPLAILAAAILLHPDLSALLAGGGASFLGIPVKGAIYPASVLPAVLLTLLQRPVERLAERITPAALRAILKPLIVLLAVIPLALWVIGPAITFAGDALAAGFHYLYGIWDLAAVVLLSLLMPLLILLGLHHWGVDPADSDPWSLALLAATAALCGVALATLRSRDKGARQVALGASITAIAGIPEPAVYGTALSGSSLLAASVAAGAGGLYGALTRMQWVTEGSSSPLTALIYGAGGDGYGNLIHLSMTLLIPLLSGLGLDLLTLRFRHGKRRSKAGRQDGGKASEAFAVVSPPAPGTADAPPLPLSLASPFSGEVIPLSRVSDPAFASGVMGQGCAIIPVLGKVYAPCDGVVTSVSAGKNALSMESSQGVQLLIHIGLDSAKLCAECFDLCCRAGDRVKQGDLLLSFDIEALSKTEADLTTPLLVLNADRYDDLSLTCESRIQAGDRLLTLMPKERSR